MNKKIFDKSKEKIEIDSFLCVSVFFISKENEQEQTKMWVLMNDKTKKYKLFASQVDAIKYFRSLKLYAKMKVQSINFEEFTRTVYTFLELERQGIKVDKKIFEIKDNLNINEEQEYKDAYSKYDTYDKYRQINFKKIKKILSINKECEEFDQNNLIENQNQENVKKYDFVILGGGQTGITLAKNLIQKNLSVLIIDKSYIGYKTSLTIKNFGKLIRHQIKKGLSPDTIAPNISTKLYYINDEQNRAILKELENNDHFEYKIGEIDKLNNDYLIIKNEVIKFKKFIFATGSKYDDPDYDKYPNIKRQMYFNLDEINRVNTPYSKVAIYGTNIDALELADAFCFFGAEVYLFDENVNPFNNFDDDLEATLKSEFHLGKINWMLETKIEYHTQLQDNKIKINYNKAGIQGYIEVDKIFITDNKISNTTNFDINFDVPLNKKGSIIIDNTFRVKNRPNFFAIGDVNGLNMIPSQGNYQAISLANNFLGITSRNKFDSFNKTFTIDITPQFAFYGMNKNELDYINKKYNEFIFDFGYELNSKLNAHKSKLKLYTNNNHEILGVFLYGHKIKELLPIFILMAKQKIKFNKLSSLNLPFYSKAEALREAASQYEIEFVGISSKFKKINKIKKDKKMIFLRKNKK